MKIVSPNEVKSMSNIDEYLRKDDVKYSSRGEKKRNRKCKRLFEKMRKCEKFRDKIFILWKPMHKQFVSSPLDYDGFKFAYEAIMTRKADWNKYSLNIRVDGHLENDNEEWQHINRRNKKPLQISEKPKRIPPQMIYIWIEVNGLSTVAYIDSGGGATNMLYSFAEKAGLAGDIDTFYRSTCHGVHTVKTLGKMHSCKLEIGGATYETGVGIWTENEHDTDVLIGIDFLRLHDCVIDLPNNRLLFGEHTSVEFLTDEQVLKWRRSRKKNYSFEIKANKDKLDQIIDMGFAKDDVEVALKESLNNVDETISKLFHRALRGNIKEHPEIWELQTIFEEMNRKSKSSLDEEKELECRQLFEQMKKPLKKLAIYYNWPVLHSQYINFPRDYEGFKEEYAKYLTMKRMLKDMMNNSPSSIGKALLRRKRKEDSYEKSISQDDEEDESGHELGEKIDPTTRETYKGVGGDYLSDGTLACSFEIGKAMFEADCTIVSGDRKVVIGLDFLRRHRCVIDCARNRITLMGDISVGVVPDGKISKWSYCFKRKHTPPPSFKIDNKGLNELIAMNFSKEDAVEALKGTLNDLDLAVSDLYYVEHDREIVVELSKSSKE